MAKNVAATQSKVIVHVTMPPARATANYAVFHADNAALPCNGRKCQVLTGANGELYLASSMVNPDKPVTITITQE